MAFNTEDFIGQCLSLNTGSHGRENILDLMTGCFSDGLAVLEGMGTPQQAGIEKLHVSDTLTVINVVWSPGMTLLPHNHNMWAIIGVYCGREDNIFWRRLKDDPQGRIEAAGARSLGAGTVMPLGKNIIHSVTNPTDGFTGAIHVYGGNFFEQERSEWEPLTLHEQPYDIERNLRKFS